MTGLLNDVFISDSALYASIAKEMALSNNFLNLTFDGVDWLDKPHFPFWITAISFKLFGINIIAYKLPAILFTLLALVYTYKLARELYNRDTAIMAVLILATAEHLLISNNDVRAEPYLTGLIIASIYYYHRSIHDARLLSLVLASLFAGFAVMTKGLFTLIPIIGAIGGELIIKRNWKMLFKWRWLLSLLLIALFISPELYALHYQFDSHPEKIVFGQAGVSGIRFFLWDSQFGRFFNTGPITGTGDPFFFLHTLIWAFLPWSVLMYYAMVKRIRNNIPRLDRKMEFYSLSGSLLALLVFSLSGFQLPHYTNIIFPLLAILTADFIYGIKSGKEMRFFSGTQYGVMGISIVFIIFLQILFRPEGYILLALLALLLSGGVMFAILKSHIDSIVRVFYLSALISIVLNFFLNLIFYPQLLQYQSGSKAAEYANANYPGHELRTLGVPSYTIHFNAKAEVRNRSLEKLEEELQGRLNVMGPEASKLLVFTSHDFLDHLEKIRVDYEILEEFEHYHTTMVTGTFLNHKTRNETLRRHYLISAKMQPANSPVE
ncbi:ArnT family glycosyltransferase [Bacteroidota bacterium]